MREKKLIDISDSLQVSLRTEIVLMRIRNKKQDRIINYVVEYPVNGKIPSAKDASKTGVIVSDNFYYEFKRAISAYELAASKLDYINPPSFLYAYMYAKGEDLYNYKILC